VAGHAGAARQGHEFALEADQAARRDTVFEAHAPLAVRLHVLQVATAAAELFHDAALIGFFDIDGEQFVRLQLLAIDFLHDHARPRYGQFVAFAAHVFQQDGEVQFAAAGDQEDVGILGVLDAQGDVGQEFLLQALAQLAAGDIFAFLAGEGRGVDLEVHGQRRLIHFQRRQADRAFQVAQRHADADLLDAGDQHDVAGFGFLRRLALQPLEDVDLLDLGAALGFVAVHHRDFLARPDAAMGDAADADAADVAGIVERTDLQLQRPFDIDIGLCHMLEDRLEQRLHVLAGLGDVEHGVTVQRRSEHHREIHLLFGGAEFVEQVEGMVDDPVRAGAGAIDLVDHHDRLESQRQRLAGDEAGLRHRPLDGVHQQQCAIHHRQDALDLAAEIGVAWGVDDVDVSALVVDRAVFGEDGDAAFPLQIVRVHDALGHLLVGGEGAGLAQHLIHQGGLAVVDVGDDSDVSDGASHNGGGRFAVHNGRGGIVARSARQTN